MRLFGVNIRGLRELTRLVPGLFAVVEDYLGSFATRAILALILLLILAIFLFTIF